MCYAATPSAPSIELRLTARMDIHYQGVTSIFVPARLGVEIAGHVLKLLTSVIKIEEGRPKLPERTGTVTDFVTNPKKNDEVFGVKLDNATRSDEFLYSFPDYRGEPFQDSDVKRGDRVRLEYTDTEKGGQTKRYISVLEILDGASPAPTSEPSEKGLSFGSSDIAIPKQVALYAAVQGLHAAVLGGTKIENAEKAAGAIAYLYGELVELLRE